MAILIRARPSRAARIWVVLSLAAAQLGWGGIFGEPTVTTSLASQLPIPLPAEGECHAGRSYVIESIDDLYNNLGDLECIFAAGHAPKTEPLGFSYGYLMTAANTGFWSPFANYVYQGDISVRTMCKGVKTTVGWMSIGGVKPATAHWHIVNPSELFGPRLADSEYPFPTERKSLLMDFRIDWNRFCPPQYAGDAKPLIGFMPFYNSIWPSDQFVDLAVVVGRDKTDGGVITLNKAMIVPKNEADGIATILIYATKNFDPVVSDIVSGQPIVVPPGPKGESSIRYRRIGVRGILQRLDLQQLATGIKQEFDYPWLNRQG